MNELRDHSQPCDHGGNWPFKAGYPGVWMCRAGGCPGGREVTIDYEAAGQAAWYVVAKEEGHIGEGLEWDDLVASDSQPFWIDVGKAAVDAALGVAGT